MKYKKTTFSFFSSNGYSLMELIIVLSIIGLLSSIAAPRFTAIQDKAKESVVKSIAHSLRLSLETHFLSYGGYPSGQNMPLISLIETLSQENESAPIPKNPFTQKIYTTTDASGQVLYSFLPETESYSIKGYGRKNEHQILSIIN